MEEWKPISGYEGLYEVSNQGRVRSLDRTIEFIRSGKIIKSIQKGKLLNPSLKVRYKGVQLCPGDGKKNMVYIHKIVANAFVDNPDNKLIVNHIDGDKHNNNSKNLEWVTQKENIDHAFKAGLIVKPSGEDNPTAKLTNDEVYWIRCNAGTKTHKEMANKLGVARSTVSNVVCGTRYKKIK